MEECPLPQTPNLPVAGLSVWPANRPKKKGLEYYDKMKESYEEFIEGNELLPMQSVMEVVNTSTISLLTTEVKEAHWCQQGRYLRSPKEPQYWC